MAKGPESRFRNNVVVPALKLLPNTFFISIQQLSLVGDPDIILCVDGRFIALELKSANGKLKPLQAYKLQKIIESGGLGYKVDPMNWQEVHAELLKIAQGGHKWEKWNDCAQSITKTENQL